MSSPQNTYVASFIGSPPMNFLEARIDGGPHRPARRAGELGR